ncbi:hypothetical protein JJC03_08310 [Flavobacterium oreochromis]|uniref:hypothetical protein n=3 Tax=Flavobacterium oreochromis TaxID=2906078 RepID=UPI001CE6C934|nr:hypothetical protein [Flavobacterium oreochromis]QYS87738.1 hypothetical protein JJC03_08310 [Flavobacterium oreochromis]
MKIEDLYNTYFENINSVQSYFNKFGSLANDEDNTIKHDKAKKIKEIINDILSDDDTENLDSENDTDETFTEKSENNIIKTSEIELTEPENFSKQEEPNELEIPEEKSEEFDEFIEELFQEVDYRIKREHKINPRNYELLSRSSFLMLNNYFEYLLADLLNYYYNKFRKSLNDKEFKITLKELTEFENIDEAIKSLIIKEVESILVEKSFNDLLEHFEKKLSIGLEKELIDWNKIIEIRERRHLIVHNSSIINKKYISRTGNPYKYKLGEEISVDSVYFLQALNEFKLAGQLLLFNCWGEWDKNNIDNAIYEIMVQTYEDLKNEKYNLVCKTYKFSERIEPRNDLQEDYLLRVKFNNAIALKKQNLSNELKMALKEIKIGTSTPIFKISYNILNDNFENIEELFQKAILLDEIIIDQYLEWPIFDFVRSNKAINDKLMNFFNNN